MLLDTIRHNLNLSQSAYAQDANRYIQNANADSVHPDTINYFIDKAEFRVLTATALTMGGHFIRALQETEDLSDDDIYGALNASLDSNRIQKTKSTYDENDRFVFRDIVQKVILSVHSQYTKTKFTDPAAQAIQLELQESFTQANKVINYIYGELRPETIHYAENVAMFETYRDTVMSYNPEHSNKNEDFIFQTKIPALLKYFHTNEFMLHAEDMHYPTDPESQIILQNVQVISEKAKWKTWKEQGLNQNASDVVDKVDDDFVKSLHPHGLSVFVPHLGKGDNNLN